MDLQPEGGVVGTTAAIFRGGRCFLGGGVKLTSYQARDQAAKSCTDLVTPQGNHLPTGHDTASTR